MCGWGSEWGGGWAGGSVGWGGGVRGWVGGGGRVGAVSVASLSAPASLPAGCGTRNASMDVAFLKWKVMVTFYVESGGVVFVRGISNTGHAFL